MAPGGGCGFAARFLRLRRLGFCRAVALHGFCRAIALHSFCRPFGLHGFCRPSAFCFFMVALRATVGFQGLAGFFSVQSPCPPCPPWLNGLRPMFLRLRRKVFAALPLWVFVGLSPSAVFVGLRPPLFLSACGLLFFGRPSANGVVGVWVRLCWEGTVWHAKPLQHAQTLKKIQEGRRYAPPRNFGCGATKRGVAMRRRGNFGHGATKRGVAMRRQGNLGMVLPRGASLCAAEVILGMVLPREASLCAAEVILGMVLPRGASLCAAEVIWVWCYQERRRYVPPR